MSQPVLGVRWLCLDGERVTSPVYHAFYWAPRTTVTAQCPSLSIIRVDFPTGTIRLLRQHDHFAPDPDCHCGLYAHYTLAGLLEKTRLIDISPGKRDIAFVVLVEATGRVVLHESGFRAQHMRPLYVIMGMGLPSVEDKAMHLLDVPIINQHLARAKLLFAAQPE